MKGIRQLKAMFADPRMKELIVSLWREYPGLYNEKYNRLVGELVDPWLLNHISLDIEFGQALGQDHLIEGNRSAAFGQGLNTKSFLEIILGTYNLISTDQNPLEWIPTDLLLSLGNGADAGNRSNAFEIFKSGLYKLYNAIQVGEYNHRTIDEILVEADNGTIQYKNSDGLFVRHTDKWIPMLDINVSNKWHPDGLIFSASATNVNEISFTDGEIFIHQWNTLFEHEIELLGRENYHPEQRWSVTGQTVLLLNDLLHYIFAVIPIAAGNTTATIEITPTYKFEQMNAGYIYILMGIANVPSPYRFLAMDWGNASFVPQALPVITTRWIDTGTSLCEIVGGYNTGIMLFETKEQARTGNGAWADTATPHTYRREYSNGLCETKLIGLWMSVGPDPASFNHTHEFKMDFQENTMVAAHSLLEPGMNYLFFSVPANKKVKFYNADNQDITTHFSIIGTDVRPNYHTNSVYVKDIFYDTSISVRFYINIYY